MSLGLERERVNISAIGTYQMAQWVPADFIAALEVKGCITYDGNWASVLNRSRGRLSR